VKVPVLGVIENMRITETKLVEKHAKMFGIKYLGSILFDHDLEKCVGNPKRLLGTKFAGNIKDVAKEISRVTGCGTKLVVTSSRFVL